MRDTMFGAYRATGADPPFGDPRGYHGVGMEGYFWRLTDPARGRVVITLAAVNRDAAGRRWGMVALAAHPGGFVRAATVGEAHAGRRGLALRAGDPARPVLEADEHRLRVDLGPDARVDASFSPRTPWPRRWAFGGIGPAQAIPALSQYWHPHLLVAGVRGGAVLGGEPIDLGGATAYAEKNWGAAGHPPEWWWGQAHGFARPDVCVAFAGGRAAVAGVPVRATAVVVAVGDEVLRIVRPVMPVRVEVGDHGWLLRGRTARHTVEIEGHADGTPPHLLPVPLPAEGRRVDGRSAMHLAGAMRVHVRRGRRTLFAGASALAGLERGRGPAPA